MCHERRKAAAITTDLRQTAAMSRVDDQPAVASDRALMVAVALFVLTVGQLVVATFVPGLPQFEGKAFGSRLVAYPLLMAAPVVVWWVVARRRGSSDPLPWAAFRSEERRVGKECSFRWSPYPLKKKCIT